MTVTDRQNSHTEEELELMPIDALEDVDLSLPAEFQVDIFASELLEHISTYQRLAMAARAARHNEDHARAEQISKQMLYSRIMASLIQRDYPGAKAIADDLAILRAKQAAAQRATMLGLA